MFNLCTVLSLNITNDSSTELNLFTDKESRIKKNLFQFSAPSGLMTVTRIKNIFTQWHGLYPPPSLLMAQPLEKYLFMRLPQQTEDII